MTSDRKAAIAAYKERKTVVGIYAGVRCTATSEAWVGQAPNLETSDPEPHLVLAAPGFIRAAAFQAAWSAHGPTASRSGNANGWEEEEIAYVRDVRC